MKYLVFDVETTGIDIEASAIIQLAGYIIVNQKIVEKFNLLMRPFFNAKISDEALAISRKTRQEIETFPPANESLNQFASMLRKYVPEADKKNNSDKLTGIAYNARFDFDFLINAFKREKIYPGLLSYLWHPVICAMNLSMEVLKEERARFQNFKLATVCEHFQIHSEEESLHDALYDVDITWKLYQSLSKRLEAKKVEAPAIKKTSKKSVSTTLNESNLFSLN